MPRQQLDKTWDKTFNRLERRVSREGRTRLNGLFRRYRRRLEDEGDEILRT